MNSLVTAIVLENTSLLWSLCCLEASLAWRDHPFSVNLVRNRSISLFLLRRPTVLASTSGPASSPFQTLLECTSQSTSFIVIDGKSSMIDICCGRWADVYEFGGDVDVELKNNQGSTQLISMAIVSYPELSPL
jgi:hypothetical protein